MQFSVLDNILTQNFSALPVKEYLQQITDAHPYFTPAQFYLLQQLTPAHEDYAAQAAKTAMLFNNPHWLQFQLQQIPQPLAVKQTPVVAMYAANSDIDDDSAEIIKATETIAAEPTNILTATPEKIVDETVDAAIAPIIATTDAMYAENSDNDDDSAEIITSAETIAAEPTKILPSAPEKIELETADEAIANQTELPAITEEPFASTQNKIDLTTAITNAANDNALAFEPMHLVDYFASQGIKLTDDVQTADKLGKQLKSFTEWLKIMRKVHVPEGSTSAGLSDMVIQTLAAKSNTENEILTEAMAVVFAQQGKAAKAIELYQKLSLLNPPKSAYFAAKIEQLKGV